AARQGDAKMDGGRRQVQLPDLQIPSFSEVADGGRQDAGNSTKTLVFVQRTKAKSGNTNCALSAPLFAYFAVCPGKVGQTLTLQEPVMFSEESIPLTDQQVHEVL